MNIVIAVSKRKIDYNPIPAIIVIWLACAFIAVGLIFMKPNPGISCNGYTTMEELGIYD